MKPRPSTCHSPLKTALIAFLPITLCQTSQGIVTALFEEQAGGGVLVSLSGTLLLDSNDIDPGFGLPLTMTFTTDSGPNLFSIGGTDVLIPLDFINGSTSLPAGGFDFSSVTSTGQFGVAFSFDSIQVPAPLVQTSQATGLSTLTFDPTETFAVFSGSLADLGADPASISEGTPLFTAGNTNDTIIFSTGVPEPSTTFLGALCGLTLLRRRRRR